MTEIVKIQTALSFCSRKYRAKGWLALLLAVFFYSLGADFVYAQNTPLNCTSQFTATAMSASNSGLITAIMSNIVVILQGTADRLYNHIIQDPNGYYQSVLSASIILVIAIYGVMVTFDMANLRPGEVLSRMFKIGLVVWIASPSGGWDFFSGTFAKFFYGAMMDLIRVFLEGAAGMTANASSTNPPSQMDPQALAEPMSVLGYPISLIFSAKYAITILGLFSCGLYGILFALMLIWAGFSLLMAIFQCMFVYVKSIVGLWFLFALAPIFFIFLLFQRTAKLFEGYLNMIINFTLQPVLLFAFLAFFVVMITSSLTNIFRVDWCFTFYLWHLPIIGLPFPGAWFRPYMIGQHRLPNGGVMDYGFYGSPIDPEVQFPIEMIDMLFFMMSSYLMIQYGKFVPQLASQLSQGGLTLGSSMDDMRQFFNTRGWTPEQLGGKALGKLGNMLR